MDTQCPDGATLTITWTRNLRGAAGHCGFLKNTPPHLSLLTPEDEEEEEEEDRRWGRREGRIRRRRRMG